MSRNGYKYFDKKKPTRPFSTSLGEMKDIDEMYKEPDLDEKNEVATEQEVVEEKPETVKYKDKEYSVHIDVKKDDQWHDGVVTVLSNMRAEPNMGSDILSVLQPGTNIRIYSNMTDGFYKIKFGDLDGYLKSDLAKIVS